MLITPNTRQKGVHEPSLYDDHFEEYIYQLSFPTNQGPLTFQSIPIQPGVEQPGVEQPGVEQPGVEQPGVEQPRVEQPSVEQPSVEQPSVEQPSVEQPSVEQATSGPKKCSY